MPDDTLKFDIKFADEPVDAVLDAAKAASATDVHPVRGRGFAGMEWLVVGMIGIPMLANLIMKLVELWSCGVRVDARGTRLLVQKDCNLPRGSVLTVRADGSTLHRPEELSLPKLSDLFKALRPGA